MNVLPSNTWVGCLALWFIVKHSFSLRGRLPAGTRVPPSGSVWDGLCDGLVSLGSQSRPRHGGFSLARRAVCSWVLTSDCVVTIQQCSLHCFNFGDYLRVFGNFTWEVLFPMSSIRHRSQPDVSGGDRIFHLSSWPVLGKTEYSFLLWIFSNLFSFDVLLLWF